MSSVEKIFHDGAALQNALQNAALAASSLEEAAARLRESLAFNRGDPQPHNALGDTLVACAESASVATETLACYNAALGEGYSAALRLDSRNSDALVGTAEVQAMSFLPLSM